MRALYAWLLKIEAVLAGSFLMLMVALIFAGGVARLMRYPLNWTVDLATCFFAWGCFLCADVAWRRGSLMSIDLLVERLPARAQKALRLANYAIIAVFLAYLTVMGTWLAWTSRVRSFQGIPEISYAWVTMSAAVGGLLLLVTTILKVKEEFK